MKLLTLLTLTAITFTFAHTAEAKGKRMTYAEAKSKCLEEDPGLAGKALQSCIKKMKKKKAH